MGRHRTAVAVVAGIALWIATASKLAGQPGATAVPAPPPVIPEFWNAELLEDYVPTGFKGAGVATRAVPGHPFGLSLSPDDKAALIAFLRTL